MAEIFVPQTKPATEWVRGRALQKVSPQRKHALAQGVFFSALYAWAKEHRSGRVGTEWDFRIAPPGEPRRPLVPDVAFLSYSRIPRESPTPADIPLIAPDVVAEVLSPGDAIADTDDKVRTYLAAGTMTVVLVDTERRIVTARQSGGDRVFVDGDEIEIAALPHFSMTVASLFEEP